MTAATSAVSRARAVTRRSAAPGSRSRALVALVLLGIALAAAPVAFKMFTRAPRGATMLSDFKPFMTNQRLDGFHHDIAGIDAAVREVDGPVTARLGPDAVANGDYASLQSQWPVIHADMTDLLDKVQDNLGNYQAVAALPSFRLFPWFFVIPGVLIAGFAGVAIARPGARRRSTVVLALLGIGLVAAPAVFQMFTRAPQGGRMMTAFSDIETRQKVTTVQDYFSTMAVGQGAIRLQIEPALRTSGLTATQVAQRYPAVTELNRDWVHILNDMTPMIGAMSDNVTNYQAVAALPAFALFPWFFVIPGVLGAGLALVARRGVPTREGAS
jgi:hypothetical protein